MSDIVVGVDDSVGARRALDRALVEAEAGRRAVRVLHAWTQPISVGDVTGFGYTVAPPPTCTAAIAQEVLDEVIATSRAGRVPLPLTLTAETVYGDARQVLVERSHDAGLLVVGGRGLGEVRSAVIGSVTLYALHHATCPLMIVPDHGAPARPYQRVVVGADGSPAARSAMRWALDAAARHRCPLVVVHGWLLTTVPGAPPMPQLPPLRELESECGQWLRQEVEDVLPDRRGVDVLVELSHSTASWALLDTAGPDDLLVVGSRGRGGFASLMLGSVASQCAQRAEGVVVVVRAGEERLEP